MTLGEQELMEILDSIITDQGQYFITDAERTLATTIVTDMDLGGQVEHCCWPAVSIFYISVFGWWSNNLFSGYFLSGAKIKFAGWPSSEQKQV